MKKDFYCRYSILDNDVICEHKLARVEQASIATLHNHDGYEIVLFLAGGGEASLLVESDEKKLERGDLIFIDTSIFHGIKLTDIASYDRVVINIRDSYMEHLCDEDTDLSMCFHRFPSHNLNFIHLEEAEIQQFIAIAEKLEKAVSDQQYGQSILVKAYLSELLVRANRCANTFRTPQYASLMPPMVTKTFDYIEENLTSDLTVENLASTLHHNSDYLSRVFKSATGSSLKQYINAKKISRAQLYLRQGYSPYDVCFMVGYNNYSSFSRRFSGHVGISPKKYQMTSQTMPVYD